MIDSGPGERLPLPLQGDLGIQRAGELHQGLLKALDQTQWLELDLSEARDVGLCCLQLLCAAHRSARRLGKRLTLAPGISPDFRKAVERSGYPRQWGCEGQEDADCLWNLGG